jgi:3-hydroxyisobutyrate dehydrogenase-like beta-hydroxyacid dehydrogenase
MTRTLTTSIAFIGFGELGQRFARDLHVRPDVALTAYDIATADTPQAARLKLGARDYRVQLHATAAGACRDADVVFSAVTANRTEEVAEGAAKFLKPGQYFVDVNSSAPTTKRRAAMAVEAANAHYVEGAVMGPVLGPGIKVEILAGGPAAAQASDLLNALGMNLTPVSTEYGKASAIKLCRSIVIKGIEALMVDCAHATRQWGVENEVYRSLARTFPATNWATLAEDMTERVATHGVRRAAEMREAAEMLTDLGLNAELARAVADAQLRGVKER